MIDHKSKRNQTRNYLFRHKFGCCRIRAGSPKFIKFCDLNFIFLLHLQKAGLSQINPKNVPMPHSEDDGALTEVCLLLVLFLLYYLIGSSPFQADDPGLPNQSEILGNYLSDLPQASDFTSSVVLRDPQPPIHVLSVCNHPGSLGQSSSNSDGAPSSRSMVPPMKCVRTMQRRHQSHKGPSHGKKYSWNTFELVRVLGGDLTNCKLQDISVRLFCLILFVYCYYRLIVMVHRSEFSGITWNALGSPWSAYSKMKMVTGCISSLARIIPRMSLPWRTLTSPPRVLNLLFSAFLLRLLIRTTTLTSWMSMPLPILVKNPPCVSSATHPPAPSAARMLLPAPPSALTLPLAPSAARTLPLAPGAARTLPPAPSAARTLLLAPSAARTPSASLPSGAAGRRIPTALREAARLPLSAWSTGRLARLVLFVLL